MMIKGQLEEEVKALHFPKLIIFNLPALERKNSDRKLEVMATKALYFFNFLGLFMLQGFHRIIPYSPPGMVPNGGQRNSKGKQGS